MNSTQFQGCTGRNSNGCAQIEGEIAQDDVACNVQLFVLLKDAGAADLDTVVQGRQWAHAGFGPAEQESNRNQRKQTHPLTVKKVGPTVAEA